MGGVLVYHGGTETVSSPLCDKGRENLDFGQGFYVTSLYEQAQNWAIRMMENRGGEAFVNVYTLQKDEILKTARCKIFEAYDSEWLHFIVANRNGENAAEIYDYIEGGVADDRVINSINMYMMGYYDEETTLKLLAMHQPNNQICMRKQDLIDKYLRYERTEYA